MSGRFGRKTALKAQEVGAIKTGFQLVADIPPCDRGYNQEKVPQKDNSKISRLSVVQLGEKNPPNFFTFSSVYGWFLSPGPGQYRAWQSGWQSNCRFALDFHV